jgi:hypothetical protein
MQLCVIAIVGAASARVLARWVADGMHVRDWRLGTSLRTPDRGAIPSRTEAHPLADQKPIDSFRDERALSHRVVCFTEPAQVGSHMAETCRGAAGSIVAPGAS